MYDTIPCTRRLSNVGEESGFIIQHHAKSACMDIVQPGKVSMIGRTRGMNSLVQTLTMQSCVQFSSLLSRPFVAVLASVAERTVTRIHPQVAINPRFASVLNRDELRVSSFAGRVLDSSDSWTSSVKPQY